ncbi:MerR family transcriptional regulator [Streptomonospora nanhaiensis]|uniref:DNA-binding transcriptional MerR regulator n=1 Tax=Streptomonospora nanhaiensis TaxID=1323731 RepID=A0A853BEZ9_9ACTN|nr:MerR family transcriptional regulator [Streptomonospora nanhaiensis]MBV2364391.1 MerR family transcriptional regulator [Streptomonospora nanhaiensis]MBX9388465.1 MerR family transcriptional regulator [Streptomonospora nanhaiensis]NYI94018.1 DNA-binding transcriptional MerR regulator [Streptomonospora nanhaiensis]
MSTASTEPLTISAAAERVGLSADTLRYYERIGLLDPVPRTAAGQRLYGAAEMARLEMVMRLRGTGMPIQDMVEYARLVREGDAAVARRRAMLAGQRARLLGRMEELEATLRYLDRKIATYDARMAVEAG